MPLWSWVAISIVLLIAWLPCGAAASRLGSELTDKKGSKVVMFAGPIGCVFTICLLFLGAILVVVVVFVLLYQAGEDFLLPACKSKLQRGYKVLLRVANIPV